MILTLYKQDSEGRIRTLEFMTEGNLVIMLSGLEDGQKVQNIRACKAKNAGRANATSAEEQADKEMLAIYRKKLKDGYFKTREEALEKRVLLPMLADKVQDLQELPYPVFVQPKLDGMRLLGYNDGTKDILMSRTAREVDTLEHIRKNLKLFPLQLDGEGYAHGFTFQENMKLIKKYRPGDTEQVTYWVFDTPSISGDFEVRYKALKAVWDTIRVPDCFKLVPTYIVKNEAELRQYHQEFLADGFEGTIVRINGGTYEFNKRSKQVLKFKDFIDETYEIVDVIPSDKRPEEGVVVCKMPDSRQFDCNMKVSRDGRRDILSNKADYIGLMAEVRFFEFTDGGLPRFPVYCGYRLDK